MNVEESSPPLVSIVVPTYNNEPYVRQTLNSILNQTYTRLEVIVSDHGSTDGTWEAVQPFALDPRVTLLRIPRSNKVLDNWANASRRATGAYLKLVCGDDLLAPECIERQVSALRAVPGAVMAASRRDVVSAAGDPLIRSWGLPGLVGEVSGTEAIRAGVRSGTNPFGEPACVLLCRETLERVGGWDDRFPYVIDQHTYSKALGHGRFVGIADSLASFRISQQQWSVQLASSQYRQVVGYHREIARATGGMVTRADRIEGAARARVLSYARRFAYTALSRKMQTPVAVPVAAPQALVAARVD